MTVIGITGPSGAGKSMLSELFKSKKIPVIDADSVYHELLVPPSACLDALVDAFGTQILNESGELDRTTLSHVVFNDAQKLALLNETVLDFVLDEIRDIISLLEGAGERAVAVDAPTLIESGFHKECDEVISVLSDTDIRISRIVERDGIGRDAATERVKAQNPDSFYAEHSSHIIVNNGEREDFLSRSEKLMSELGLLSQ